MGLSLLFGAAAVPLGNVATAQADAPAAPAAPSHTVMLTAYNAVPSQTDDNPFETASGAYSNPEIIAARSADLAAMLPFGTIIELDGSDVSKGNSCGFDAVTSLIGYRVIADTMNVRYADRIDVLFSTDADINRPDGSTMNAANVLGICKGIAFRVVGHVDINHLPKTQAALAALVAKSGALAVR